MSVIKIIDTFTFYGFDIITLAALTCICVQILKVTLLKKCQKKIITFLPFISGTLFYAIYACVIRLDVRYLSTGYTEILEHGFAVGAAATLFYVWYEQFIREKSVSSQTEAVISTLIEGYVPNDALEATAKAIADAIQKDVAGDGALKAAEILAENADEGVNERDIKLLSRLIIETLARLSTTA